LVVAFAMGLAAGCARRQEADAVAIVCAPDAGHVDERTRLDLGLLTAVPPRGYSFAGEQLEVHGAVGFLDAQQRTLGLGNGYWGASSFRDRETGALPKPDCEFQVDGIPVQVFHYSGIEDRQSDTTLLAAVIGFPARPEGQMVMQSLASANVRGGDQLHAEALRDFIRSIRRGDAREFVRAPNSSPRFREQPN
jgi:hypothetical protein